MITHKIINSWSKTSPRRLDHAVSLLTCFNPVAQLEVVEAGVDDESLKIFKFSPREKNENSYKNTGLKNL